VRYVADEWASADTLAGVAISVSLLDQVVESQDDHLLTMRYAPHLSSPEGQEGRPVKTFRLFSNSLCAAANLRVNNGE
jgi:hypothetical protein